MASKCMHCKGDATPVWNSQSKKFDYNIKTCIPCSERETHWDYPFIYKEIFSRKGLEFCTKHPEYPVGFQGTDRARSPLYDKAESWEPKDYKCGLILHGETGGGKSRAAWLVFNKLWMRHYPDRSLFLQMRKFEGLIEKGFDDREHGKVLDILISCPVLVLDDFGKERLTQRLESDIFAVLDERTSNLRTTIITTNYTGDRLVDRFSNKETGVALVRRLRDYFVPMAA